MRLTNNQIALVAILFMISSLLFNTTVYQRATVMVTGKSTVDASVILCINRPPVLSMNCPASANVDSEYSCDVDATDQDNNILIGIQNLTFSDDTSLFDINSSTGLIEFTPSSSDTGTYTITITVEDNSTCANSADSDSFTLKISYCGDGACNGDETCSTCPQDCGDCPTVPAPPTGGGGGAARVIDISKKILLELSAPPTQTLFSGDEIEILVVLRNKGDVALYNISLNVETDAPNVTWALSDNWFKRLLINEGNHSILNIKSLTDQKAHIGISRYAVTLNASVLNPEYSTSIRFFIDLKERDYETRIETLNLIQFARDLFKQNPECLEFNEIIEQAQEAYDNSDYDKAMSLINSAIQACRDLISLEEKKELEKLAPRKIFAIVIFIIEILFLLILILAMLYYYYKKRREKQLRMPITKKSDLELKFNDALNRTKKFMGDKNLSKARKGYLSLWLLYKTIRSSSLPIDVKSDCYNKLSKVYSKLSGVIKRQK